MKSFPLFIYLLLINLAFSFGQSPKSYTINPGETYSSKIPLTEIYEYPDFQTGYVILKNNTGSTVQLNYNRLYQEIVFIDPAGDTLALASPELVKVVKTATDEFYYASELFVKLDTAINNIKLAIASYFTETKEKEVGYGKIVESSGLSRQAYMLPNSTSHIGQRLELTPNDIVTLYPKSYYTLVDENNKVYEISRKQLFKIFVKDEKKLKDYLSEKKPSFRKREDLVALLVYMTGEN